MHAQRFITAISYEEIGTVTQRSIHSCNAIRLIRSFLSEESVILKASIPEIQVTGINLHINLQTRENHCSFGPAPI